MLCIPCIPLQFGFELNSNILSFVTVFDFSSANRSRITEPDRVLPLSSFFGECLSSTSPNAVVTGNAFACQARDVEAVKAVMQESVYCREVWAL